MIRSTHLILAALLAAVLGTVALAPARAASLPAAAGLSIDGASRAAPEQVQYRRYYRPRRVYRRVYYRRPVYYRPVRVVRRCVVRPRLVWTPYGYVRRYVRICR